MIICSCSSHLKFKPHNSSTMIAQKINLSRMPIMLEICYHPSCANVGIHVTRWPTTKAMVLLHKSFGKLFNLLHTEVSFPTKGKKTAVKLKDFDEHYLNENYWLDTQNCKHGRKINRQQIFELFSAYSGEVATDVREGMLVKIRLERDFIVELVM